MRFASYAVVGLALIGELHISFYLEEEEA